MKESSLSIMAFILLLTVFSIVALTAGLTDNSSDNRVSCLSENLNESKSNNGPIQNQINYFRDNAQEPEPENAFIAASLSRPGNNPDEAEPEDASTGHRVKHPIVDYNDGKDPDSEAEKDEYVYTDESVE